MTQQALFQEIATERQISYINTLLNQRLVPQDVLAVVEEALTSKAKASHLITMLTDLPKRYGKPAQVASPAKPVQTIANGFYTVADGQGGHVTFRVSQEAWCEGKTVIAYLNGSDNTRSYKAFGFITADGLKVWQAHRNNGRVVASAEYLLTGSVDKARAEFLNQAEANAMSSNTCLCCLRLLTVPASVHRGLGPVCAEKMGVN
jgi:hypothetical protein